MTSRPPREEPLSELSSLHVDTLGAALEPLREAWRAQEGLCVELEGASNVVTFSVSESDLATLRTLDRLVRSVVRSNRRALTLIAEPPEPEQVLRIARQALDPVRREGYRDGDYEVDFGPAAIRYALSPREARGLRRYHRLLARIYAEGSNHEVIDSLVARRSRRAL